MGNGTEDDRQKYLLLNSLGRKHYNLLANLLIPERKSFEEAVGAVTTHFQPQSSVVSEQYSFQCWCQKSQETIADFVVSFMKLIIHGRYTTELQPIVLHNRSVFSSLLHKSTKKRFLTESDDLTFECAIEIANLVKKETTQAKHMKLPELRSTCIHNLKAKQPTSHIQSHKPTCHHCGGPLLAPSCIHTREMKIW
uniref:Retrotransposon gag domain-containing protein n=1 Tax=Amphimedon queenslandica TaxID=400682 RepID=A0A1X7UZV7_AMPQE